MHTTAKEKDSSIKDSLLKDSEPPALTELSTTNVPNPQQPSSTFVNEHPVNSSEHKPSDSFSEKPSDNNKVVTGESSQSDTSQPVLTKRLVSSESTDKNGAHWSKLKRAAISKEIEGSSLSTGSKETSEDGEAKGEVKEATAKKPGMILSRKTKHYR